MHCCIFWMQYYECSICLCICQVADYSPHTELSVFSEHPAQAINSIQFLWQGWMDILAFCEGIELSPNRHLLQCCLCFKSLMDPKSWLIGWACKWAKYLVITEYPCLRNSAKYGDLLKLLFQALQKKDLAEIFWGCRAHARGWQGSLHSRALMKGWQNGL